MVYNSSKSVHIRTNDSNCLSKSGLQDSTRLQLEDIQQPRVCGSVDSIGEPGLRGRLPTDQDVHRQNELRQGVGGGVPTAADHRYPLLDRGAPSRTSPVAGQGVDADGKPPEHHLLRLLVVLELCA